jgi:hypothetical protein
MCVGDKCGADVPVIGTVLKTIGIPIKLIKGSFDFTTICPTPTPAPAPAPAPGGGMSDGAIAGTTIACLAAAGIGGAFIIKKRKRAHEPLLSGDYHAPPLGGAVAVRGSAEGTA